MMSVDLVFISIVTFLTILIIGLKSDVSILTLALFMGLVLSQILSPLLFDFLEPKADFFATDSAKAAMKMLLLFTPLIILEKSHPKHSKLLPVQRLTPALVFSIFVVAAVVANLPGDLSKELIDESVLVTLTQTLYGWILSIAAIFTLMEMALEHGGSTKKSKKKKK